MDYSGLLIAAGVLIFGLSVMFLWLLWTTLEEAREYFYRENQKAHRSRANGADGTRKGVPT
jgi:hypothetical protein